MTQPDADRSARGARLVSAGILLSRVLGFGRTIIFGYYFAGTYQGDAYNAAIRIPNTVRGLLGEGAISASFVPVYAAALERGDVRGARALANALLGVLFVGVGVLTVLGIALAPVLTALFASGASPEAADLTTRLLRVLFPMTGLMVLSGWCLGVQNAHRRFFISYASAAMWSVAQIALLLVAGPRTPDLTVLVWWLGWATIAGAVLQILAQLPQVWRLMESVRPSLDVRVAGLRPVLASWLPIVSTLGLVQISGLIDLSLAWYLPEGSVTNLQFAQLLYQLPLSLFGVAAAAAALPEIARRSAVADTEGIAREVGRASERVLFYTIPSAVAFIGIGHTIVGLLYRGGKFGVEAQRIVWVALATYALGIVAYAMVRVFVSAFQAVRDYRTPLIASAWSLSVSAIIAATLALTFRMHAVAVGAIALGSVIGAHVNVALLRRRMRAVFPTVDLSAPLRIGRDTLAASLAALVPALLMTYLLRDAHVRVSALAVLPAYGVTFLLVARRLGLVEADRLLGALRRRIGG